MHTIKNWLLLKLIKHCYLGITPKDFPDISQLNSNAITNYCLSAEEIWNNEVFQVEMMRLRYKQEQYLALSAQSPQDLVFGRAVLFTIKEILDRFQSLAVKVKAQRLEDQREES